MFDLLLLLSLLFLIFASLNSKMQYQICTGNVETARQVLKRAAELRVLNCEQIMSLSTTLVEDRSGSIQNGQLSCMLDTQAHAHTC